MTDVQSAIGMLQAISTTDAVPLARVGSNDGAAIMKMLDAGAYGVICPMISTANEALRFASACRYPPTGQRSFGPARGLLYGGADYFNHANNEILAIAMIETRLGVENLTLFSMSPRSMRSISARTIWRSISASRRPRSRSTAPTSALAGI